MAKSSRSKQVTTTPTAGVTIREAQDDPHRLAAVFMRKRGLDAGAWSLKFWRDQWWTWNGLRYRVLSESDLRGLVTATVKAEFDRWAKAAAKSASDGGSIVIAKVTSSLVTNVLQALRGEVLISGEVEQPAWVGQSAGRTGYVFALRNGLLDLDGAIAGLSSRPERKGPIARL